MLACAVFEILFGGARGGGKTDGMLGDFVSHAAIYGQNAIGLMVRRSRTELRETIERAHQIYGPLGAVFSSQDKMYRFPNGARITFAYLENDRDAENYQGHSYTRVYVEEMGNFPSSVPVLKLMATLRSAAGVPVCFRATANPGGVGHMWIKARYIDDHPSGWRVKTYEFDNPITGGKVYRDRIYIPSRLKDNKILMDNDPNYIANLQMQASPELVRAWLDGDWNVIAGTAFENLRRDKHIIRRFDIPHWWTRFTSIDWGTAKPYAVGWYCVAEDDLVMTARGDWPERLISRGSIIRYRELYGFNGKPDEGVREESWQVAKKIAEHEAKDEKIAYRIADSAMWAEHDGPSAAYNMMKALAEYNASCPSLERSRKDRRANYLECRARLNPIDGEGPGFYTWDNSPHFWRTVPELQLDTKNPESGWDTKQEDHVADEWAYAIVSQPTIVTEQQFINDRYDRTRAEAIAADRGATKSSYSRYSH